MRVIDDRERVTVKDLKDPAALRVVPLTLKDANALVTRYHRHHRPVVGHRFSLGVVKDGELVGAAIMGRPVARMSDPTMTLEVTRLVTDGTRNACSALYGAAARAARAMGFAKIQTYVLASERGTSLKASGWTREGPAGGGQWKHTDGRPRRTDQPTMKKTRWAKPLGEAVDVPHAAALAPSDDLPLFNQAAANDRNR